MKPITYANLASDYQQPASHMIIEQCEYKNETRFYTWLPDTWKGQRKMDFTRAAYFIVKPKTKSND